MDGKLKNTTWAELSSIIAFFVLIVACPNGYAQVNKSKKQTINTDSIMPAKARWAFKTNTVDWLFLLPNIGVEFDISKSPFKHYSLSLNVKSNWFTPNKIAANTIYDLSNARLEFRRYRRTTNRNISGGEMKRTFGSWLKDEMFTWKRKNPRYWRAYYLGGYLDGSYYNMKFSPIGHRGYSVGAGLSMGYGIPVYQYRHGAIDVEFGTSLGLIYTKYDTYTLNQETNRYCPQGDSKSKVLPMLSDIRVAFVYRFESIKNKYKLIDYERIEQKAKEKLERERKKEEAKKLKVIERQRQDSLRCALKLEKKLQDSIMRIENLQQDSIRRVEKLQLDSLKRLEKAQMDSLKRLEKGHRGRAKRLKKEMERKNDPSNLDTLYVPKSSIDSLSVRKEFKIIKSKKRDRIINKTKQEEDVETSPSQLKFKDNKATEEKLELDSPKAVQKRKSKRNKKSKIRPIETQSFNTSGSDHVEKNQNEDSFVRKKESSSTKDSLKLREPENQRTVKTQNKRQKKDVLKGNVKTKRSDRTTIKDKKNPDIQLLQDKLEDQDFGKGIDEKQSSSPKHKKAIKKVKKERSKPSRKKKANNQVKDIEPQVSHFSETKVKKVEEIKKDKRRSTKKRKISDVELGIQVENERK